MKKELIKVNSVEVLAMTDENGNAYRITDEINEEKARQLLATNIDCYNCLDCSYCKDCDSCVKCDYCEDCEKCTECSWCDSCTNCKVCLSSAFMKDCENCVECKLCIDAQDLQNKDRVNFQD